jgi:itaconate CoA-transferase
MKTAGQSILRYELSDRIQPYCMFVSGVERALIKRGMEDGGRKVVRYIPNNFHQAVRLLTEEIHIDTFVTTVSPMDAHGYFSFGTGNDYSTKVARSAKRLIVEVNRNMPRVMGEGAALHVSEVHAVVENDVPLLELPVGEPNAEDLTIAKTIASMVPDGACLQMGVGGLPNAVCGALADRKDLGIHSEVLCPGMVDLINAGMVTGAKRPTSASRCSPSPWARSRCTTSWTTTQRSRAGRWIMSTIPAPSRAMITSSP